jgi:hypothetical protein
MREISPIWRDLRRCRGRSAAISQSLRRRRRHEIDSIWLGFPYRTPRRPNIRRFFTRPLSGRTVVYTAPVVAFSGLRSGFQESALLIV